jgi:hypothetical protein
METKLRVRSANLTWQQVDDEIVVLDLTTSRYLSLNGTAVRLWQRLVDGAGVNELAGDLSDEFDVPNSQARADVVAFLEQCRELGLVE